MSSTIQGKPQELSTIKTTPSINMEDLDSVLEEMDVDDDWIDMETTPVTTTKKMTDIENTRSTETAQANGQEGTPEASKGATANNVQEPPKPTLTLPMMGSQDIVDMTFENPEHIHNSKELECIENNFEKWFKTHQRYNDSLVIEKLKQMHFLGWWVHKKYASPDGHYYDAEKFKEFFEWATRFPFAMLLLMGTEFWIEHYPKEERGSDTVLRIPYVRHMFKEEEALSRQYYKAWFFHDNRVVDRQQLKDFFRYCSIKIEKPIEVIWKSFSEKKDIEHLRACQEDVFKLVNDVVTANPRSKDGAGGDA